MAGRGGFVFFSRRDGAGFFFSEAGRGGCFFSEAGRGGFFFFRRDGTGRCFFFFRGPGRDGCFWRWQFFWRDGAKSLHRAAKGGLNRPASHPCKALIFLVPNKKNGFGPFSSKFFVPIRVALLTGFLPLPAEASICLYCQPASGQSRVYRVMQLSTDGVHCRDSTGTGPVVLKVIPATGTAFASPWDQIMCGSLFPHSLMVSYLWIGTPGRALTSRGCLLLASLRCSARKHPSVT